VIYILTIGASQTIYADSPIDSSLFSLYVQQNYTQFCDEIEECEGVSEWLSWVDSSGGEAVRPIPNPLFFSLEKARTEISISPPKNSGTKQIHTNSTSSRLAPSTPSLHLSREGLRSSSGLNFLRC